jgi:hypothetical protein
MRAVERNVSSGALDFTLLGSLVQGDLTFPRTQHLLSSRVSRRGQRFAVMYRVARINIHGETGQAGSIPYCQVSGPRCSDIAYLLASAICVLTCESRAHVAHRMLLPERRYHEMDVSSRCFISNAIADETARLPLPALNAVL